VPQWVLDDAAGHPPEADTGRSWSPAVRKRRRNWAGVGRAVLVIAVIALAAVAVHLGVLPGVGASLAGTAQPELGMPHPTPGHESSDAPLGTPLAAPAGSGAYEFMALQADGVTPVAYDPCRPVHYVIHPDGEPAGGEQVIAAAIARVSEATGLQFVHDGATDEASTRNRQIFQPARYGDRWAPVLFAWESDTANPHLAGEIVGEGGSTAVALGDGPEVFVTGTVSLDAGQFPQILRRRKGTAIAQAIVMHELGHLVGLDHVDDDRQLMYPTSRGDVLDFAAGDRTGLAALGTGRCVPAL
jgi:hypothetical protein